MPDAMVTSSAGSKSRHPLRSAGRRFIPGRSNLLAALLGGLGAVSGSMLAVNLPETATTIVPSGFAAPVVLLGPTRATPPDVAVTLPGWIADPLTPPDPRTATPTQVAAFFARTTTADATALTRRFPEIAGNLDGVPTSLRFAANRARHPQPGNRQILAFDDRSDGRIVEVLGDLDTADRIVVLLPGVDNTLANFDTGHGHVQRRSPSWQARQLHQRLAATDPRARVSVVSWLGYDPPEGMGREVLREDRAAAGAVALDRFIDGLVLGQPGRSVVVIGHSYGSTVAGLATPHLSPQVTDVIAIGSPGMGVDSSSDLHTTARVWACTAPSDGIRRVPGVRFLGIGHGRLPSDPEFGALAIPCDDVEGHDGYFMTGTSALAAMTRIAAGTSGGDPR